MPPINMYPLNVILQVVLRSFNKPSLIFNIDDYSLSERIRIREYFIIIQGILNYSDWLSSGSGAVGNAHLYIKDNFLPNPHHYQLKAKEISGNVLVTLPT